MKITNIQTMAIFMICLVLVLPFYAADAYASINNVQISGADEIEGFRRRNDQVRVSLLASGPVSPLGSEVRYRDADIEADFTCVPNADGRTSNCEYATPIADMNSVRNLLYFDILNYDSSGNYLGVTSHTITRDSTPPTILFSISNSVVSSGEDITINYNARDFAYVGSSSSTCVGLSKIEFFHNNGAFHTINVNQTTCVKTGSFTFNPVSAGLITGSFSGEVSIQASATDRFGQVSTLTSQSFDIDQESPRVSSISVKHQGHFNRRSLIDVNYFPIHEFYPVIVNAVVTDPNSEVDISSISADLTCFYPRAFQDGAGSYASLSPSNCVNMNYENDTAYNCTWGELNNDGAEIYIQRNESATCPITLSVSDMNGNVGNVTAMISLTADQTPPDVAMFSYERAKVYNGVRYLYPNATFNLSVKFNEAGGMQESYVWIDQSQIMGGQNVRTDSCQKISGSQWECSWDNLTSPDYNGQTVTLSLVHQFISEGGMNIAGLSDDFGNVIDLDSATDDTVSFFIYKDGPAVYNHSIYTHGTHNYNETLRGDAVSVDVYLNDYTYITEAYANFSELINNSGLLEGSCTSNSTDEVGQNRIKCSWSPSSPIDTDATYDSGVQFYFEDFMGYNTTYEARGIEIMDVMNSSPDFWTVSAGNVVPNRVDRQAMALLQPQVYATFPFTSNTAGVEMLSVNFVSCSGLPMSGTVNGSNITDSWDYVDDYELLNMEAYTPPSPMVHLTLKNDVPTVDSLNFNCSFTTVSRKGLYYYPEESDTVTFTVNFYNSSLGGMNDSVSDEINNTLEELNNQFWTLIGSLATLERYCRMICNLIGTWYKLQSLLGSLQGLLKAASFAAGNVVPTRAVGTAVAYSAGEVCRTTETAKQGADEAYTEYGNAFCKFVNCEYSKPESEGGSDKLGLSTLFSVGGAGRNFVEKTYAWSDLGLGPDPSVYMNARDSLVISLITVCIPGIIYNLNKWRNIQCYYVDCLQTMVPQGVPMETCQSLRDYQECKYIYGEIFRWIGITALLDWVSERLYQIFYDPFSALASLVGLACWGMCDAQRNVDWAPGHWIGCILWKLLGMVGELIQDILGIVDGSAWTLTNDYCTAIGLSSNGLNLGGLGGTS